MSNPVKQACLEIFRESFEGIAPGADGTWFVEKKEAIFDALTSLTPEQASAKAPGQTSSIGAHAYHLCYYLHLFNVNARGEREPSDWEGSWKVQEFDAESWKDVEMRTRKEFEEALAWYQSDTDFPDAEDANYAVGNVAHAAYHLGAIRALIPVTAQIFQK